MSSFCKEPVEVLDKEQTLALLASPGNFLERQDRFEVKSQYLCDFLDEMQKDGYVYNRAAQERIEQVHGIGPFPDNSVLGTLIYNAQKFRDHDALLRDGWNPVDDAMLSQAYNLKRKLLVKGESALYSIVTERFVVRPIEGRMYAFRPRCRKPFNVRGMPGKLD